MWTDLSEEVKRYLTEKEQQGTTVLLSKLIWEYGEGVADLFPLDPWVLMPDGAIMRKPPDYPREES